MVPSPGFQSRLFVLANENRTQDAGHALLRQGRNPKVRKNSGVIEIGAAYAQVQDYLATCGCYRSASYAQWEPEDKADPWLIAAAKVLHATIVTNEQAVKPTRNQPLKREPKIPDVAEALGVRTMGLREFYDASGGLTHRAYPIQPAF